MPWRPSTAVASAVSDVAFPVRFRWYRAIPARCRHDPARREDRGRRQAGTRPPTGRASPGVSGGCASGPCPVSVLMLMADDVTAQARSQGCCPRPTYRPCSPLSALAVLAGADAPDVEPARRSARPKSTLRYALDRAGSGRRSFRYEPEPGAAPTSSGRPAPTRVRRDRT